MRVCHLFDPSLLKSTRRTITAAHPRKWNRHRVARLRWCWSIFAPPSRPNRLAPYTNCLLFQAFEKVFLFWLQTSLKHRVGSLLSRSETKSRKICIAPLFHLLKQRAPCRLFLVTHVRQYGTHPNSFFAEFFRCHDSYHVSPDLEIGFSLGQ